MASERLTDETLNRAILRVKETIKDKKDVQDRLSRVRREINETVRGCADNVRVIIYIDGVLDEPMVFSHGKEENKLVITLERDGGIDYTWADKSLGKYFRDGILGFTNRICSILVSVAKPVMLALTFL